MDDRGIPQEDPRSGLRHHRRRVRDHPHHRRRRGDVQHHQAVLRLARPRRDRVDAGVQRHLQDGDQVRRLDGARRTLLPSLPALRDGGRRQSRRVVAEAEVGLRALRLRLLHRPHLVRSPAFAALPRRPGVRRSGAVVLHRRAPRPQGSAGRSPGAISLRLPFRRVPARRLLEELRHAPRRAAGDRRGGGGAAARRHRHRRRR